MPDTVIRCERLTKFYGKHRGVQDLTLEVRPGQVYGFLGPNGAGKTTTIRCLLSMIKPTSGSAYLFDQPVGLDGKELRRRIGYVPGDVRFLEKQTGRWVLDYASGLRGGPGVAENELCERLQYDPSRRIHQLSKGNKQKLALVVALMHNPDLLILDEPTSGLDPINQQVVFDILEESVAEGASVFLSSHIMSEVERVCHRVAMIRDGDLIAEEAVDELLAKAIRTIDVVYENPEDRAAAQEIAGAQSVESYGETGLRVRVSHDIDGVLRRLMQWRVVDMIIEHASLEEVFLHLYGIEEPSEPVAHGGDRR